MLANLNEPLSWGNSLISTWYPPCARSCKRWTRTSLSMSSLHTLTRKLHSLHLTSSIEGNPFAPFFFAESFSNASGWRASTKNSIKITPLWLPWNRWRGSLTAWINRSKTRRYSRSLCRAFARCSLGMWNLLLSWLVVKMQSKLSTLFIIMSMISNKNYALVFGDP